MFGSVKFFQARFCPYRFSTLWVEAHGLFNALLSLLFNKFSFPLTARRNKLECSSLARFLMLDFTLKVLHSVGRLEGYFMTCS